MENTQETENVTIRAYRFYETETDAKTFMKFLVATGYENVSYEYVKLFEQWRVWFDIK